MKLFAAFVFSLSLLLSVSSFAQRKPRSQPAPPPPPTEEEAKQIAHNQACVYYERHSVKARRRSYPYRGADSVILISFDKNQVQGQEFGDYLHHEIPVYNKRLHQDKTDEVIALSQHGIDSLSDILYNWTMRGEPGIMVFNQCYIPRNAVLFVNKEGIVTDYIEICFQCQHMHTTNKKIKKVSFCTEHWSMFKQFFIDHGIKIGTLTWEGKETYETEPVEEELMEEEQDSSELEVEEES